MVTRSFESCSSDCAQMPARSFSVLPIARACQANCSFCFSKASVSDVTKQRQQPLEEQLAWADLAIFVRVDQRACADHEVHTRSPMGGLFHDGPEIEGEVVLAQRVNPREREAEDPASGLSSRFIASH